MDKQAAYAHFDARKAELAAEQAQIDALKAQGVDTTALQAAHNTLHNGLHTTWTAFLAEQGWEEDAAEQNRSGGEDKPPREGGEIEPSEQP